MIAKNEELRITSAIQSVLPVVSEIIVVDTGSQDRTIELVESLGAKVVSLPWSDDFSKPRNDSLIHATKDWILILDADEKIAQKDLDALVQLTHTPNACYFFRQRHYTENYQLANFTKCCGEYPTEELESVGYFETPLVRLFPNFKGIEYRGIVHELVEASVRENSNLSLVNSNLVIHHYGHKTNALESKRQNELYERLAILKVEQEPSWKSYFELGVELLWRGKFEKAEKALLAAAASNSAEAAIWLNLANALKEQGRLTAAEEAVSKALELQPRAWELHCTKGNLLMLLARYQEAEGYFLEAIRLNSEYAHAYAQLAFNYAHLGQFLNAKRAYLAALKLIDSPALKCDLGAVSLFLQDHAEAKKYLENAISEDPEFSVPHYYLAQLSRSLGDQQSAIESLKRFCQLEKSGKREPRQNLYKQAIKELAELS